MDRVKLIVFKTMLFLGCLVVLAAGCISDNGPADDRSDRDGPEKINIFVSILPQADWVQRIGGNQVEVAVLIPPGANPGSYELSTGQLKDLSSADLYITIGHIPFEKAWLDRIKAANPEMQVADSSVGIQIENGNPHIWLSPRLAKIQAENTFKALAEFDPDNREYYRQNTDQLLRELDVMDQEIKQALAKAKQREFMVYHPAWYYFARDYGLEEMAIEKEGSEPTAKELSAIINDARQSGISVIYASPQHDTKSAEAVAQELGVKVVTLDPLPQDYGYLVEAARLLAKNME